MRKVQGGALAFLVVASLAATPALACRVERVAEIPVRNVFHFLVAPAAIGQVPVRFLLDTGAEGGLIEPQAARALNLPVDPRVRSLLQGTGGEAFGRNVLAARLQLGTLVLEGASLPVGTLVQAPHLTPPVVGLLGADVLSRFDLDLDAPAGRLGLHTVADCPAGFAPLPQPSDAIPLRRDGVRVYARVTLDGHPLDALVDTGALSTAISPEVAARLGVGPRALAQDPGGEGGGIGGRSDYRWHRFRELRIGAQVQRNPTVTVAPLHGEEMLLGNDWLLARRVWLSYAQDRIFVPR